MHTACKFTQSGSISQATKICHMLKKNRPIKLMFRVQFVWRGVK